MKVLLVHNGYATSAPSGENSVLKNEYNELLNWNYNVYKFELKNNSRDLVNDVRFFIGILFVFFNIFELFIFQIYVLWLNPDVIHFHNVRPTFTNSLFHVRSRGLKVLTIHNYRMVCPKGTMFAKGAKCTKCIDESWANSLNTWCEPNRIKGIVNYIQFLSARSLRSYDRIDKFIVLNSLQRSYLEQIKVKGEIIFKPNLYAKDRVYSYVLKESAKSIIFLGRYSRDKGFDIFVDLSQDDILSDYTFECAGGGKLSSMLSDHVVNHGMLNKSGVEALLKRAAILIVPSRWLEGYPMVILEAWSLGIPVFISSEIAISKEKYVSSKFVFDVASGQAIAHKLGRLLRDKDAMLSESRRVFDLSYLFDKENNIRSLLNIYNGESPLC